MFRVQRTNRNIHFGIVIDRHLLCK